MEKPTNTIIDYFMIVSKYFLRFLLLFIFLIFLLHYTGNIDINDYIDYFFLINDDE
jgi:hypothetical protein